ncbi:DUF559 domain-containing protein [Pseudonocardia sp. RS010]|uniref:DUF559 domain-containing protein n=1 Tax=Pseudonocardia sp. RS010 TaxID=3385979 RepID=UPI0039A1B84E
MSGQEIIAHGVRRRADLDKEIGRSAVHRAIRAGEWRASWPGVLVPTARSGDPLTIAAAALTFAGDSAVITGWTASWLHGCTAVDPLPVQVAVPYGHWLRSRPGLVVHNGLALEDDQVDVAGLPVLGLERVVADLLCRDRPHDAFAVLDQALAAAGEADRERRRAVIGEKIATRPDPRGRKRALVLLGLASGRALSPAESRMLFRLVDLGFPAPEANLPVRNAHGTVLFLLDHAWPEFRIALEYDGHAAHLGREEEDAARQAELERRGYIVIRVRAEDMRDVTRLEQELSAAFRARGLVLRRQPGSLQARRHRDRRG